MSEPAIRVVGLGKKFRLTGPQPQRTLRDTLVGAIRPGSRKNDEEFWALRDVSFDIMPGDVVGIIGRNGAGKSTLLKILSKIIPMTSGRVELRGRVGSLLEVGTGFHSELSGRENIYLNGAILGMRRKEIEQKFDEIVAFAEVDRFLDTPVKHYSSGMYVRLAFSVAAHLDPEILIVDEVLAVGDAMFQRKCLGKMQTVSGSGRTVLFVSHQMDTIRRLCRSAIVLDKGQSIYSGPIEPAIDMYLESHRRDVELSDRGPDPDRGMRLRTARVVMADPEATELRTGDTAYVEVVYDINRPVHGVQMVCHVEDLQGGMIASTGDSDVGRDLHRDREPGQYRARFPLPERLNEGTYQLTFALGVPYGTQYDRLAGALSFDVVDVETASRPQYLQRRPGVILHDVAWEIERIGEAGREVGRDA